MVLESEIKYKAPFKEIKKEKDVIKLLNDVGKDLHMVGLRASEASLKEFLRIIEKGKYEKSSEGIKQVVDLSDAKFLVNQYRRGSEGGCQSCKKYGHYMPFQDEHVFYCGLDENPEKVDFGKSQKIKKFYETGCEDKKPVFTKTIEEIISSE